MNEVSQIDEKLKTTNKTKSGALSVACVTVVIYVLRFREQTSRKIDWLPLFRPHNGKANPAA